MIVINEIEMDDGVDEPNERDEDFDDESPLGPEGCLFPGNCCMPGPHYESECHTPEMLMAQEAEAASAPNAPGERPPGQPRT